MQRRDLLKYLAGVGTVAGLSPLSALADRNNSESKATVSRADTSRIAPVTSAKNLVIVVNMLGYNQHTFNPQADDLNSSPLLAHLKDHHGDLTVFKGIMQPEIVRGHNGGRGGGGCRDIPTTLAVAGHHRRHRGGGAAVRRSWRAVRRRVVAR